MAQRMAGATVWIILILAIAFLGLGILVVRLEQGKPSTVTPTTLPTTNPAPVTRPTTAAASAPKPVDYMDVVRIRYPELATTQPLVAPLAIAESAKLVLPEPVYLDNFGELWITRSDAEATSAVLKAANERSTHVLRETVVYVHRAPDENGVWQPQLVVRDDRGRYELVTQLARQDLPERNYDWARAFEWNTASMNSMVVPTDRGISIIRPDRRPMEAYHEFIAADQFDPSRYAPVQALIDWQGILAWMPWENDLRGSDGAARFVNDKWTRLDSSAGWPSKILHLVPLRDGSVLQVLVNDEGNAEAAIAALDTQAIDEKEVQALVEQLSDPDALKRVAAFNELTRWGPGLWPVLERLMPDQPPEAQIRMQLLLANKLQPTLAGMLLQPGPIKVITRSIFGSAILYSDAGVVMQREGEEDLPPIAPAWISIVPGRAIELVSPGIIEELKPKGRQIRIVRGEWIINDEVEGPRWWLSNHLSPPLLKEPHREFQHLVGQDHRGRWLFRRSADEPTPTLIIDPTLPDPTPRLPVWVYSFEGMQVGWTKDNWPAIKRGGAWALVNADWKPLDEKKEPFITSVDAEETSTTMEPLATSMPSTLPTTAESLGKPILIEPDGTRFYDGLQTLRMIKPDGTEIVWPLPAEAVGSGQVHLFRAGENRLFLFNEPGRVLRIRQTPDGVEPFALEATFTRKIPNNDRPQRIWLDPSGRLIIADGNALTMLFPTGRIPPDIAKKMTAQDLKDAEE